MVKQGIQPNGECKFHRGYTDTTRYVSRGTIKPRKFAFLPRKFLERSIILLTFITGDISPLNFAREIQRLVEVPTPQIAEDGDMNFVCFASLTWCLLCIIFC